MNRMITGGVLVVIGVIWILQGLDVAFAPVSFMTGDLFWTGAGTITVLLGAGLAWWGIRSRRRDR